MEFLNIKGDRRIYLAFLILSLLLSITRAGAQSSTKDLGWPRRNADSSGTLTYYQPQLDNWADYKTLTARMAFSLIPKKGKEVLGVASLSCHTLVDKDDHMVYLKEITITDVRFPSLRGDSAKMMEGLFKKLVPTDPQPIALDRLMADLKSTTQAQKGVELKNDPPAIFYSGKPAVLLMVEKDPVLVPIEKLNVEFVVNTNWDLFYDKKKKDYYLLLNTGWMNAKDLNGPWAPIQTLPKDMSKLPAGQNFDDVKKMVPPPPPSGTVPKVFFSKVPAELILLKGAPVYTRVKGTTLLYIANTDNNVFLNDKTNLYYVLLSGRWFSSKALSGPWVYAGDSLPGDFAKIPKNSAKANVLSSVPGTTEASDAVLLSQVPQTAIVNKAQAEAKVKVVYDGDPRFVAIDNTSMLYAANTTEKVIKVGDLYYLCFQGVWFMSANSKGPWKTADSVPQEIYTIPVSSPIYNVTYVTQSNATETTVESSTTDGYLGMFVVGMAVGACIVYGTGYYYPPYIYYGPMYPYPIYRPYPYAYGAGFAYNPWTGGYAGGRVAYGPYGAVGSAAWYNPATGNYGRAASVQTPYGGRTVASAYNPYTGAYAKTSQGHNAYSQWGTSVASKGNQWAQTGHVTTANGTTGAYRTSNGQSGVAHSGANGSVVKTNNGVYAGKDGNVYKKDNGGNWSQYNNGGWNSVNKNQATQQNLNNSEKARTTGQQQTQNFQNFQRNGGGNSQRSSGGGNFQRGGGGGARVRH
jgi:hypothetical protein